MTRRRAPGRSRTRSGIALAAATSSQGLSHWTAHTANSRRSWARTRDPAVKKVLAIFLGVLTAIGGCVDIGDLVGNSAVGARFELNLAWVLPVGVAGIGVYAE